MNYDGHIVMKVNLHTGDREPMYVFQSLSEAVQYVESMNSRGATIPMPEGDRSDDDYALALAGELNSYNGGIYYLKNVHLAREGEFNGS